MVRLGYACCAHAAAGSSGVISAAASNAMTMFFDRNMSASRLAGVILGSIVRKNQGRKWHALGLGRATVRC
jgi:hypothetical protein